MASVMGRRKALLAELLVVVVGRVVDWTRTVAEVVAAVLGDLVVEVLEGDTVEVGASLSSRVETVAVPLRLTVKACSLMGVAFVLAGETQKAQNCTSLVVFTSYRALSLQSLSAFCQLPTG